MKITYKYMRSAALLLAVAAAFAITGCQLENASSDASILRETFLTIQASYETLIDAATDAGTKTVLHDDGHVYWSPNDSISLFYGSGVEGGSKFIAQNTSEVRVTNFSGKIGVVTGGDEITEDETYFWGLYPYDAASSCDGQTVTMQIAPEQKGAASTFSSGYAPSLGRAKGLMLSFKNIYSGLIFSVKKPGFRSLTLTTNNGVLIAGKAKVGIGSDNNPVVRDVIEGTNSVTVYAPTPEGFEVGKNYYMILFPFTGGFTLRLNSATQTGVFSFTGSMTFARNKLNTAEGVDKYCQFEDLGYTHTNEPFVNGGNGKWD